jgi:RNA polymerase sigma-70 factor (ECF subfamily)
MATASPKELARWRPQLLAFAQRRMRNREHAEDAVQDTLAAALEGLDGYAGKSSLRTWVFGILKHKMADAFRHVAQEESLDTCGEEFLHDGPGPEQACASASALSAFGRSLGRLPAKSAHAFVLREVLGMDTPDVCAALSITRSNCWVLVYRARARLRACPEMIRLTAEAG